MKRLGLNTKILDRVRTDQELNGIVAKSINTSTLSMPRLLKENHPKLTQASALLAIREYLGVQDKDILCFVQQKNKSKKLKSLINA
jgi:hypothetical protein